MKVLWAHWTIQPKNEEFLRRSTNSSTCISRFECEFCLFRIFRSLSYVCPKCGVANNQILLPLSENSAEAQKEAKELGNQINFIKVSHLITCIQKKRNRPFSIQLKKTETKSDDPSTPTTSDSISSSPSEPILDPQSSTTSPPAPPITASTSEIRSPINLSMPRQNDSDTNLLSMFIFICCMILSFLLLRRIFLIFGTNRSYPPPSSDPFHDDF